MIDDQRKYRSSNIVCLIRLLSMQAIHLQLSLTRSETIPQSDLLIKSNLMLVMYADV